MICSHTCQCTYTHAHSQTCIHTCIHTTSMHSHHTHTLKKFPKELPRRSVNYFSESIQENVSREKSTLGRRPAQNVGVSISQAGDPDWKDTYSLCSLGATALSPCPSALIRYRKKNRKHEASLPSTEPPNHEHQTSASSFRLHIAHTCHSQQSWLLFMTS